MTCPNLALIGPTGAGKDTIAGFLVEDFGYEQHALADSLRLFVAAIDPRYAAAVSYYGYEEAKSTDPYVRQRLIDVGQAARQWIHPDVWVYSLFDRLDEGPIVVTDVRYTNEVEALADEGFDFITVTRTGHGFSGVPHDLPVAPTGYQINNFGDLSELRDKVHATMLTAAFFEKVGSR